MRIGFLINPIAGMGGRVGLKGTDGVVDEALRRGAKPLAASRAAETLTAVHSYLKRMTSPPAINWLTCSGAMGSDVLNAAGFSDVEIVFQTGEQTARRDTICAVRRMLEAQVKIILFCGGDGTARDICTVTGKTLPILGIPSGVKMYSGAFGINPQKAADLLIGFVTGRLSASTVDVVDLDEDLYRQGEWAVRLYHTASTPYEKTATQSAKALITERSDIAVKDEIADYLVAMIRSAPQTLFLLGPGSTVQAICAAFGIDKTLLGIDAIADGQLVASDVNERDILALLDRFSECKLVLSPIGAQGFVLGRGNLQVSPAVIERIGVQNLIVVATPAKLARTPILHFDTGSARFDADLAGSGYIPVVIGYRRRRLARTSAN